MFATFCNSKRIVTLTIRNVLLANEAFIREITEKAESGKLMKMRKRKFIIGSNTTKCKQTVNFFACV